MEYQRRLLDSVIAELLTGFPAVMVVGPRASGKTTTARRHVDSVVRLDRELEAAPFRADPDVVLRSLPTPVLLDEWQLVPEVLGAVKRAVDDQAGSGRFVLTGSVRAELLEASWAATGRVIRVCQWGLSQREMVGDVDAPSFFDRIFDHGVDAVTVPRQDHDLRSYVDLALLGGYPDLALQPSATVRSRWIDAYVDQLVTRDAALGDERRNPVLLRRYLQALASNTAGVVEHKTVYDAAGVTRTTGVAYDSVFEMQFVTEQVPAWHSNQLNRLTRTAKRYLVDPALMGPLLKVDTRSVLRNGDLLGRIIDTFVVAQLRPEAEAARSRISLSHLRLEGGEREIDLVVEGPNGDIIGIECKASSAPSANDARHLAWFREQLGERFRGGIVFHTGTGSYPLGDSIVALPISALWAKR
jgi:uncharacterized protein